jgi:ubiquinone/menaquinone biosynthesis C-methylase UbiE
MKEMNRGDTETQARIRDRLTDKKKSLKDDAYLSSINAKIQPGMSLLDIGCGTGHIIAQLASSQPSTFFCGLDISPAMVKRARHNTKRYRTVAVLEGDGLNLPFVNRAFDIVATRLAVFSPAESHRVLKPGGYFFECGLGPESDKEIREFFSTRIITENFCLPQHPARWRDDICTPVQQTGFMVDEVTTHKKYNYYQGIEGIMDLIEMVPLVENFDRVTDRSTVEKLVEKHGTIRGVRITWHYYIIHARRK